MKTLLFIIFIALCQVNLSAQSLDQKIQEVYLGKTAEFTAQNPDWLKCITDLVENRIKIVKMTISSSDKYIKLSQVSLLNKYNPLLQRDVVFDQSTFNPLKYDFITSAKTTMIYRIDNTDFVIVIEPQSFK